MTRAWLYVQDRESALTWTGLRSTWKFFAKGSPVISSARYLIQGPSDMKPMRFSAKRLRMVKMSEVKTRVFATKSRSHVKPATLSGESKRRVPFSSTNSPLNAWRIV